MSQIELAQLIQQTTPKVLIYSDDFREAVINIQAELRGMPEDITYYLHIEGKGASHSLSYESVLQDAPDDPVTCESLDKEDIACLLFTGGTTGLPKGAMISHRMIVWNIINTVIHDITHDDIYLNVFPLFHTGGLFVYLSSQIALGNVTILVREFDPARILELIEQEKVTVFAGVPTMYQMMTQAPNWKEADLSSLRFCTSGGAPLPVPLVEKYAQEKGVRFKQGFGMTEFGPGLFALAPEDAIRKAGSIGRPNFFIDALAVDDNNRPLGANQVGELVLKGPSMCSGYFGQPEAFAQVVDEDGWFHTGDLVRYDEEWYFFVVDRKKDMFISGGENVYPAEIEQVLYRHPAVLDAAAVGIPDEVYGEEILACVTLKPGATATEEELLAHCREQLGDFKTPKTVKFLGELPKGPSGKIQRLKLPGMIEKQG